MKPGSNLLFRRLEVKYALFCLFPFLLLNPSLNTMSCEQTFVWLSRFKKILSAMRKTHFHFYLHRMVKRRNIYIEYCYANNRRPLLPKAKARAKLILFFCCMLDDLVTPVTLHFGIWLPLHACWLTWLPLLPLHRCWLKPYAGPG